MKRPVNYFLQKTIFVCLFIGYVLYFVSFLLPRWFNFTDTKTGQKYSFGIFLACIDEGERRCQATHLHNVKGSWVIPVKVFGSIGIIFYSAAVATSFLALCWKKQKSRIFFYISVGSCIAAALSVTLTIAIFKSQISEGNDDIAFYLAIVSIFPLLYGAVAGFIVGRTMPMEDEKEDEEKLQKERRKRRIEKQKREPTFMFPPAGTTMVENKKNMFVRNAYSNDENFSKSANNGTLNNSTLPKKEDNDESEKAMDDNINKSSQNSSKVSFDREVEEISMNPNNYSYDNSAVENDSENEDIPKPYRIDDGPDVTSTDGTPHPTRETSTLTVSGISLRGPGMLHPLKIPDVFIKSQEHKMKSKKKKKSTKRNGTVPKENYFSTEANSPNKVNVQGEITGIQSQKVTDLPKVSK